MDSSKRSSASLSLVVRVGKLAATIEHNRTRIDLCAHGKMVASVLCFVCRRRYFATCPRTVFCFIRKFCGVRTPPVELNLPGYSALTLSA